MAFISPGKRGVRVELLVLANSRKSPARCIAGISKNKKLKRPVPSPAGEAVPVQFTDVVRDGKKQPLRPLDVVSFDFVSTGAQPHHKEDIVIKPETIALVRTAPIDRVRGLLHEMSNDSVWFMRKPQRKINAEFFQGDNIKAASLALMELRDFTVVTESDATGKARIEFKHLGELWDLPVTDNHFVEDQIYRSERYSHGFVCFSIGDEFEGFHYKLAAGIIID